MNPLKKSFRTPAINLSGMVGVVAGEGLPDSVDDGTIPMGSLYLRTTGEAWLKTAMPMVWRRLILEQES